MDWIGGYNGDNEGDGAVWRFCVIAGGCVARGVERGGGGRVRGLLGGGGYVSESCGRERGLGG